MRSTSIKSVVLLVFLSIFIMSCGEEQQAGYDIPETYTFTRDGASTVSFSGQTTRIQMADELANALLDFSSTRSLLHQQFSNQGPDGEDVAPFSNEALNNATKSVRSKVAASADFFSANTAESMGIKEDFDSWIDAQIDEVFPNEMTLAAEGVAGQIMDGTSVRYVNGKGLEYDQAVEKGLIGALMTDQILNHYLSPAVLDAGSNIADNDAKVLVDGKPYTMMEHKWDEAYGYLFGLASDESDPLASLGADNFLNKYLARVDATEDFAGIAKQIFDAYKAGRAAIVAGEYAERDKHADIIKKKISEVIAVRAVYYLQAGKAGLESGNYGTAFHDLSEGYGFLYSLRFTRKPGSTESYFTKEEVDTYLNTLEKGRGFWDLSGEVLDDMSEDIAGRFDFSVVEAAK